jgi:hypothetical protein
MRRTVLLLATMALALLLVGGVAASKQQRQEQSTSSSQSPTTTTDKSGGDVSILGAGPAVKASFTNGSGANFLRVKVSDRGTLLSWESPAGQEAATGAEGYALCSSAGATVHGYDVGDFQAAFGTPTFVQPTAGAFPLTVTRNTTDGKFQLKQVWAKPDATEKDITVTMTLTNRSNATIEGVLMSRSGDFDVGTNSSSDRGARTLDSAWLWDDAFETGAPGGLMLSALTFGTSHLTGIETASTWVGDGTPTNPGTRQDCGADRVNTPTTAASDLTMKVFYLFGNLSAAQSKTVKFEYGRM